MRILLLACENSISIIAVISIMNRCENFSLYKLFIDTVYKRPYFRKKSLKDLLLGKAALE